MALKDMQASDHTDSTRTLCGRSGDPEGGPYVLVVSKVFGDRVVDTTWETNGCPAIQMSACGLSTFLKGRALDQASGIDAEALAILVGGLPDGKGHNAQLAVDAPEVALGDV